MSINGKWQLASSEGLGALSKGIGVADSFIEANADFGNPAANVVEELIVEGNTAKLRATVGDRVVSDSTVPIGQETDAPGLDGRPARHFVTLEGSNGIKRIQRGDGYECTYMRTVDGNNMLLVITGPGGLTATRKYTRM